MSSWLIRSPIVQGLTNHGSGWVTSGLNKDLKLRPGDVVWIDKQRDRPEVKSFRLFISGRSVSRPYLREDPRHLVGRDSVWPSWLSRVVGQSSAPAFLQLTCYTGTYIPTRTPHFHWITEFPLFTRADPEKDLIAKGRWSSTHHPFTAPVWQDVQALYDGRISEVSIRMRGRILNCC